MIPVLGLVVRCSYMPPIIMIPRPLPLRRCVSPPPPRHPPPPLHQVGGNVGSYWVNKRAIFGENTGPGSGSPCPGPLTVLRSQVGRRSLLCVVTLNRSDSHKLTSTHTDPNLPETLYSRDDALLYIAYLMLIWAAPFPADRWHCSLWP